MPIFAYKCLSCQHEFDELMSVASCYTVVCPHCNEETANRQMSMSNFILKGEGWYQTDYKNK